MKCKHPYCKTEHKSTTGYCYEHVTDMDRGKIWGKTKSDEPYNVEDALDDLPEPKKGKQK